MNYLLGRGNEENEDGRPAGSDILAANNIIQELLKNNEVLKMEKEWLKTQLATSRKEYNDREDELKRLRFLVYLNRSRSDGLRTTLKNALEQIDSLPPPPPQEEKQGTEEESKENLVNIHSSIAVSNVPRSPDTICEEKAASEESRDEMKAPHSSYTNIANKTEEVKITSLSKQWQPSPNRAPQNMDAKDANVVQVVENGRVISVQSDLAAKLERQRISVESPSSSPGLQIDNKSDIIEGNGSASIEYKEDMSSHPFEFDEPSADEYDKLK